MTPEEKYADSLVKEAKEINFQYEILVNDIKLDRRENEGTL